MNDGWDGLRASLGALLAVCEDEQRALIYLDADGLNRLEMQKAGLVKQVARDYQALRKPAATSPPDVSLLAERCKRVNLANRNMLVLTVKCINSIMEQTGLSKEPSYGPPGEREPRRRIMDLRV